MKTLLDDFHTWFLHAVLYAEGELRIVVAEGFRAAEPSDFEILGRVYKGGYVIDTSEASRLVEVRFSKPIAWQLVDESYTAGDGYEIIEERSAVGVLARSRYLDYVMANHGWFKDMRRGPAKLYRVWTEDEVIDVVACEPPTVERYESQVSNNESSPGPPFWFFKLQTIAASELVYPKPVRRSAARWWNALAARAVPIHVWRQSRAVAITKSAHLPGFSRRPSCVTRGTSSRLPSLAKIRLTEPFPATQARRALRSFQSHQSTSGTKCWSDFGGRTYFSSGGWRGGSASGGGVASS